MPASIVIVEDHADLRAELTFYFERAGYDVMGVQDGRGLDQHLARHPCRLVLLDLGLPGEDGLQICQRLRASHPGMGIVMLTARGMVSDRLKGLEGGADAYLVKPALPEELLLVVTNLLRRLPVPGQRLPSNDPIGWRYSARTSLLTAPDGCSVALTYAEARLFEVLLLHTPRPAPRHALIQAVGGTYLDFADHRLEVAISRLRRKIEPLSVDGAAIRAARGVGYRLLLACVRQD